MADIQHSDARERVIVVAEKHFSEHGYKATTLTNIAQELNIKKASLYYHVPGGKEALYIEVTERGFEKHRIGLETAISNAGDDLKAQLIAASKWLTSQAPMNFSRMIHNDMPLISKEQAQRLMWIGYQALLVPIENLFKQAHSRDTIWLPDPTALAGSFLSIVQGLHQAPSERAQASKAEYINQMIDVLLNGLRHR